MRPGPRVQTAIEILGQLPGSSKPVERILKDWGRANRFAGSKDRAAIGEYVFQVSRRKSQYAHRMGSSDPRALLIAHLATTLSDREWLTWFDGSQYAPAVLSEDEIKQVDLEVEDLLSLPALASFPDWLAPDLTATFGADLEPEMMALLDRAPVDLRANGLKVVRKPVRAHLKKQGFELKATPHASMGLRLLPGEMAANKVQQSKSFVAGEFEVQDEGSQLVVEHCGAERGQTIVDLCAGGGGKTLALAAKMRGEGKIIACDIDQPRLDNIKPRLRRSGAENVELRALTKWSPGEVEPDLADLEGLADLVFVDAPCSGSGAWRRHPDAKWRLTPESLESYRAAQKAVLARGANLVKPDGRLVYVTCSILASENAAQVEAFLASHKGFSANTENFEFPVRRIGPGVQLSPHLTGTDGFYLAILTRNF